jgi:uncharacterized protein (DUF433 family)
MSPEDISEDFEDLKFEDIAESQLNGYSRTHLGKLQGSR